MWGVSARGGVDTSVPWLPLRSLAASRTGSNRRERGRTGTGGLPPRDEPDVAECTARSAECGGKGNAGRASRVGEYGSVVRRACGVTGTCSLGMRPRGVAKNGFGECGRGGVTNGGGARCGEQAAAVGCWFMGDGGGKWVCCGLGSGTCRRGKGRLKVNSRDGIAGEGAGPS